MKHYQATVKFYAEGVEYGRETYPVTANNNEVAEKIALKLAEESLYDDARIDRSRQVILDELDDEPTKALRCPACGERTLTHQGQVLISGGEYSEDDCQFECEDDADWYVCECGYGFVSWQGCENEDKE